MTERTRRQPPKPEWYYARPGSLWLVDGKQKSGTSFARCVAHTLDTANADHNRFQIMMQDGADDDDIITADEITEAVPLVLVRKGHLDALVRWQL